MTLLPEFLKLEQLQMYKVSELLKSEITPVIITAENSSNKNEILKTALTSLLESLPKDIVINHLWCYQDHYSLKTIVMDIHFTLNDKLYCFDDYMKYFDIQFTLSEINTFFSKWS